jgi:hypothetical protein
MSCKILPELRSERGTSRRLVEGLWRSATCPSTTAFGGGPSPQQVGRMK